AKNPASPTWSFPHSSRAICLDLSPDQTTLIAGFGDGTVAILNAKTGELLTKNQAHRGVIGKIKFLATPERFATISHDHTAGIWKTDDGSPVTPPLIHDKPIYDLATSPCGGRIITTSLDNTARVWDTFTGALHGKPLRHRDHVYHAAFSPDGSRVATASRDRTVRIWDPYRGIPITAPIHHLEAAAPLIFTPDGHHLITSSRNRDLNHWQITPTKAHPLRFAQDNAATLALFDPEEQSILTLSSENEARLFDVTTGRQKGPTIPLPGKLSLRVPQLNPAFSKRFRTKDVRVLLTRNTLPLLRAIDSRKARSFALDQSMSRLLIGQSDGTLIHWDLREARLINEITLPNSSPTCLDLQDQFALVGCLDGSAHLVNLAEGNVLHTVRHQKAISSVILDASGKRFATGSHDNTARLWSLATGAALSPPLAHSDRASPLGITCRFSPDKSLLATGGSHDTALRLWHTSDGSTFGRPFKHDDFLTAFAFSHDGTMIVTGTPTHNGQADIRIWDVETGQKIPQSIYHRGTILSLAFTQDDLNLLSTSQDGTVLFSPIAPSLNNPALATFAEWQVSRRLDSSGNLTALPFRNRPLFPSASPWLTWFSSPADQRSLAPGFHPEAQAPSVKNTYSELRLALVKSPMNPEIIECLSRALSKSRWPRHQLESEFYRQLSVELRER
ncbi:MAG: WD40 repeat protein, partial [Akkermansiaceae bacterium]